MGLGKTVQLIAFLLAHRGRGQSMVVCPASLVYNWQAEFERFAPTMDVAVVAGTAAQRRAVRADKSHEVLVTSYDLLRRDVAEYADHDFFCVTLDEAQFIKNHQTLAAQATKTLVAKHRFALTGTPVENRLSELWSIFDFLMPGLLGGYERFRERYEAPIVSGDEESAARLRAAVGPFILRRLKVDVLTDLPDKIETTIVARMEKEQLKLYQANEQALRMSLAKQGDAELARGKLQILAELTKLRQLCCDPRLVFENYRSSSCKLDTIWELVSASCDAGAKVLIFSQFTSFLELIGKRLRREHVGFYELTGSTLKKRRLELVNAFNNDDTPVFLISLKAGGTGLNLTGAQVVIHADPWWNVAAEDQATDRAHRIGQQSDVTVYKVICKDSIEERIVALQAAKADLAEAVVGEGSGQSLGSLSREDLLELLG
jgi:SNF2 family DNA or RNA helicase